MAVMRITTIRVSPEDRPQVTRILDEMNQFFARQPGFILAISFASKDGEEMGRIGIWESEDRADAVARMNHTMALRSQLIQLVGDDPEEAREEALYEITSSPVALPAPRR